eukprot:COSAG02_NODE_3118_length_7331_cov_70.719303_3_plen_391_part_00
MAGAFLYRYELVASTVALIILAVLFHPTAAPLYSYPKAVQGPTFVVATDATLPPVDSTVAFEVRSRVTITAMGEKDNGYEGAIWVVGGSEGIAGSCGSLYATFGPTAGKGSTTCPCSFGFGVQCGVGDQAPLKSSKQYTHEFGTTLDVSMQYDHSQGSARIVVNGQLEAEGRKKWNFPRHGALTLLAGDHNAASEKTEDLKGILSGFAVYQPPSQPLGWGWHVAALLCGSGLLYWAGGSAMMIKQGKAGDSGEKHIHQAEWAQLRGLVLDGARFARARVRGEAVGRYSELEREVKGVHERGRQRKEASSGNKKQGKAGSSKQSRVAQHQARAGERFDRGGDSGGHRDRRRTATGGGHYEQPGCDVSTAPAASSSSSSSAAGGGRWVHVPG